MILFYFFHGVCDAWASTPEQDETNPSATILSEPLLLCLNNIIKMYYI